MHLYKIHESYDEEISFENSGTFFYPLPYYAQVVNENFNTIDLVVLTEDTRLLCTVSPSPITRGIRHKNDTTKGLTNCTKKDYDLCISMDVMKGLNIQGYIGMAYQDSLTTHSSTMNTFLKKSLIRGYKELADVVESIYNRACVNRKDVNIENEDDFIGIPEITIIPFLFNSYTNQDFIEQIQTFYIHNNNKNTAKKIINENKKYYSFYTLHSITGENLIDACKKLSKIMEAEKDNYGQSLQSPMFNVYLPEREKNPIIKDKTMSISDFTFKDVDYKQTYLSNLTNTTNPTCYSAFETYMYHRLKPPTGGASVLDRNPQDQIKIPATATTNVYSAKQATQKQSTAIVAANKNPSVKEMNNIPMYYKMVNNIPFFIWDKSKDVIVN